MKLDLRTMNGEALRDLWDGTRRAWDRIQVRLDREWSFGVGKAYMVIGRLLDDIGAEAVAREEGTPTLAEMERASAENRAQFEGHES